MNRYAGPCGVLGAHVQGGVGTKDYDHGHVVDVDGDRVTVAWSGGAALTTVHVDCLEPFDAADEAAADEALAIAIEEDGW